MGGYCGSPASVMKNNKAQRRTERKPTDWKDYIGMKNIPTEDHIKATPELLAQIRTKYKRERKRKNIFQIILAFLSLIIAIGILYLLTI
ncbi:hypothetical protein SY27_05465 [Flavobacterium sp. 316]|uniref:Uncharacterized protein n=1 Tax=Flavobacterium sediminilitoris TaxID=2024526 RepID=A0ABY4HJ28_9FLAO|nr:MULTISPECIES: hypothetical protein [Flavobacterium]KIX22113.1 hypothetical protein SY27_05465 [Flavobacterium sp. 316]UOX32357.1 hypothetical protein LXD69_09865 [Flavobacterium sediminilitoris]